MSEPTDVHVVADTVVPSGSAESRLETNVPAAEATRRRLPAVATVKCSC